MVKFGKTSLGPARSFFPLEIELPKGLGAAFASGEKSVHSGSVNEPILDPPISSLAHNPGSKGGRVEVSAYLSADDLELQKTR